MDHWFQNKEKYKELSNIEELENIINIVIEEKKEFLKKNTIEAILKDISIKSTTELEEKIGEIEKELEEVKLEHENFSEQLKLINRELGKAVTRIKSRLDSLRETLISEFYTCNTLDGLKEIADKKLGKEGNALNIQIEIILQEEIEPLYESLDATNEVLERIAKKLENIELLNTELMKLGPSVLQKTGKVLQKIPTNRLRDAILKIRDFLGLPLKFKPWGALKLAKG